MARIRKCHGPGSIPGQGKLSCSSVCTHTSLSLAAQIETVFCLKVQWGTFLHRVSKCLWVQASGSWTSGWLLELRCREQLGWPALASILFSWHGKPRVLLNRVFIQRECGASVPKIHSKAKPKAFEIYQKFARWYILYLRGQLTSYSFFM